MKNILTFLFLTLCLFSQVQAYTDTETLSFLKEYLSERKTYVDKKINFYSNHHRHLYRSEEKYWLYQGKAEAFDEILLYLNLMKPIFQPNIDEIDSILPITSDLLIKNQIPYFEHDGHLWYVVQMEHLINECPACRKTIPPE